MNSLAPYSNHFEQRSMPSDGQRDFNVLRWLVPGAAIGSDTAGHSQIGVIGKKTPTWEWPAVESMQVRISEVSRPPV